MLSDGPCCPGDHFLRIRSMHDPEEGARLAVAVLDADQRGWSKELFQILLREGPLGCRRNGIRFPGHVGIDARAWDVDAQLEFAHRLAVDQNDA
jgi:hypothetical protein